MADIRGIGNTINWNNGGERALTDKMFPDVGGPPKNSAWQWMDKYRPGWRGNEKGIPQGQQGIDKANQAYQAMIDATRPSLQGKGGGRGSGEYVPIVWGGEAGWSEQDARDKLNSLYPDPPQQWKDQPRSLDNEMNSWTNGPGASQLNQAEDAQALANAQFGSDLGSFQPTTGDTQVLDYVNSMANNNPPTQTQVQDAYKNTGLPEGGAYRNQPYSSPATPISQDTGLFSKAERASGNWQQYGNVIAPPPPTEKQNPTVTQTSGPASPSYIAPSTTRAPTWNENPIWHPQPAQAGSSPAPTSQVTTPISRAAAGSWYPGYEVPSQTSEQSRRSALLGWGSGAKGNTWSPTPLDDMQKTNQNSWGTSSTNMWGL